MTASTYNAAGLHPKTVVTYSELSNHAAAEPDKITAIRIQGEVLTKTQESLLGSYGLSLLANDAVGQKRDIHPSHDGNYYKALQAEKKVDAAGDYGTYLHGMDEVIAASEGQKQKDETELRKCVAQRRECE